MTTVPTFRIVVLASGRGSNLQKLLELFCSPDSSPSDRQSSVASHLNGVSVKIAAVFSDRPDSNALKLARQLGKQHGVKAIAIDRKQYPTRADYDRFLLDSVAAESPDLIVLAGYMRLIDAQFIQRFHRRIINIHPSLLPAFRGLNAQEQALTAGVKIAGCTVHFVDEEVDAGPIIAQGAVPVLDGDTADLLAARILEVEHQLLPAVVALFALGAIKIETNNAASADERTLGKETVIIDQAAAASLPSSSISPASKPLWQALLSPSQFAR